MEEENRGIDDFEYPRKKTLTDLWREDSEREQEKIKKKQEEN